MSIRTKLVDINDTQKHINIEIPSDIVDAEIERVTKEYSKTARLSGFRPGKVPAKIIKEKFKEQILQETARSLVGPAIDKALHDNKIEPVDEPEIKDFSILDIGCNDGWVLHQLSDLPFKKMVGIEPREKNIEKGDGG